MAFRLRKYFFEVTRRGAQRGSRLAQGDRPTTETFQDLTDSVVFKSEAEDRAKEDDASVPVANLNGHVVAATDAQAKNNQEKKNDRTIVAQASQLPTSDSIDTLTITSNDLPYNDRPVEIEVDNSVTTRNQFLTKFRASFKTYLQGVVDFISATRSSLNSLIATVTQLSGQVQQNTAAIDDLGSGGAFTDVPIGGTLMWFTEVVPSKFLEANGQEVAQATYPLLFALIGTTYNDGTEVAGNFRLPDMRDRVPRGLNDGATIGITGTQAQSLGLKYGEDSKILTADNLPQHTHPFSATTNAAGNHTHNVSWTNGLPMEDTGSTGDLNPNNNDAAQDGTITDAVIESAGEHTHSISGTTSVNSTPNTPVEQIPQVLLLKFIIRAL